MGLWRWGRLALVSVPHLRDWTSCRVDDGADVSHRDLIIDGVGGDDFYVRPLLMQLLLLMVLQPLLLFLLALRLLLLLPLKVRITTHRRQSLF